MIVEASFRTSFEPGQPAAPTVVEGGSSTVSAGPERQLTGRAGHGSSGLKAMRVDWTAGHVRVAIAHVAGLVVPAGARLSYDLFVDAELDDPRPAGGFVALDLVCDDGTRLSETEPSDAYGTQLTPSSMGNSMGLQPQQWNRITVDLSGIQGKRITTIEAWVEAPAPGRTWIDDVAIEPTQPAREPVDLVDTRRGSNSTYELSRGNTYPGTAVPNAAIMFAPSTRHALDWFYAWAKHNTDSGYPAFRGITLTNQPSPWMGDRNQLFLTPTWLDPHSPHTFDHAHEDAKPYRYAVQLHGGPTVELTPSRHGAILRLVAPAHEGALRLTAEVAAGACSLRQREDGLWVGWVDNGSTLSIGQSRLFLAIAFDVETSLDSERPLSIALEASQGETVHARIGTSLLSVDQAVTVLRDELDVEFDELLNAARDAWAERLSVLDLEGASLDQRVSAYSSLYRVSLFPNFADERLDGRTVHASPVLDQVRDSDDTSTGAVVVDGRMAVNHGFWDTYRTVWPLYALAYPEVGAELADAFVEQFRSGGWVARWSSPGYADLMTGTSSDVAFADLDAKGAPLPDRRSTYLAGLRNATAMPTSAGVGRKDLAYVFHGAPTPECHEPVSWAFEASLNDHAIGLMAARLAEEPGLDELTSRRLHDEATYLLGRASSFVNLYDSATGFFQSRHLDGSFRTPADRYDPRTWGGDYTEDNGWAFAFPAPHDAAGLAALVGGREALRARLDEFFTVAEDGQHPGTYPATMHEITEARLTRTGQFAVSNQPVHHIPFLYAFTSTPWRAGEVARDAVRRLFRGSNLGQGYPGDEDNGEMSAWYLFAISGLYPFQVGTSRYTLHAPLAPVTTWHLPGGDLVIRADGDGDHVQSVSLDGTPVTRTWVDHAELIGGRELVFRLGSSPSGWGVTEEDTAPSVTPWGEQPRRWVDAVARSVTTTGGFEAGALVDDEPVGSVAAAAGDAVEWRFEAPTRIEAYTVMGGPEPMDGRAWRLEVDRGEGWVTADERSGEPFEWPAQIRPFVLDEPVDASAARLTFLTDATVTQVELLRLSALEA